MPNFVTTLYANGALRLTQHGPRAGGNVLVYEHDGRTDQCEIADHLLPGAMVRLNDKDWPTERTFAHVAAYYGTPGTVRIAT